MDFSLSDEQRMLQESVQKYIQNDYDFEQRTEIKNSETGFSQQHWQNWLTVKVSHQGRSEKGVYCRRDTVKKRLS